MNLYSKALQRVLPKLAQIISSGYGALEIYAITYFELPTFLKWKYLDYFLHIK